jgi:hypothetical protein
VENDRRTAFKPIRKLRLETCARLNFGFSNPYKNNKLIFDNRYGNIDLPFSVALLFADYPRPDQWRPRASKPEEKASQEPRLKSEVRRPTKSIAPDTCTQRRDTDRDSRGNPRHSLPTPR